MTPVSTRRVLGCLDAAGGIDWDVSVHSTGVRTHQLAAGTRKAAPARSSKGGRAGDETGRSVNAETDRPYGGSGQIGECLGRSRGGCTAKIHLFAEGRCRPLAFVLHSSLGLSDPSRLASDAWHARSPRRRARRTGRGMSRTRTTLRLAIARARRRKPRPVGGRRYVSDRPQGRNLPHV